MLCLDPLSLNVDWDMPLGIIPADGKELPLLFFLLSYLMVQHCLFSVCKLFPMSCSICSQWEGWSTITDTVTARGRKPHLLFFPTFFHCCSSIVVSIFPPPLPFTPAIPTSHPWSCPHLVLSMCPLYMFLKTLLPFPPIIASYLPSGYCPFVLNFNVSAYIFLACLFCWLCST